MENNFNKKNHKNADSQLLLLKIKRKKLITDFYRLYSSYLDVVRSLIYDSIKKSIIPLFYLSNYESINTSDNEQDFSLVLKKIKLLINELIPFLTIEQLIIEEVSNSQIGKDSESDLSEDYIKSSSYLIEDELDLNDFNYQYYEDLIDDNINKSINLDDFLNKSIISSKIINNNFDESLKNNYSETTEIDADVEINKFSTFDLDSYSLNGILSWIEIIESSLIYKLIRLSYKLNTELYESNIISQLVPEDTFTYIVKNSFLVSHPKPFIIRFNLNINQSIKDTNPINNNISDIYLISVNPTELEFYNIDLCNIKNKILELKYKLRGLLKKEKYWLNKKVQTKYQIFSRISNDK